MGKSLDVEIMGRQYRVACGEGEENLLLQAVAYLDRKMLEIRDAGKLAGTDRIAVMAALNMAHELLTIRSGGLEFGEYRRRIEAMSDALASAIEQS